MSVQIIQAANPQSHAEMVHAYKQRQARYAAAARKAARKPEPAPVIIYQRVARVIRIEHAHDFHVRLWQKWKAYHGNVGKAHILRRCDELGVAYKLVVGTTRKKDVVAVRQLLMWEIRTIVKPDASYPEIGRLFGGKDHTTILHAVRKIAEMKARGE